jgi:hypothetical protein
MVYKISCFDSTQHKVLSNLTIQAESFDSARKTIINIIPKSTKMIMLIQDGKTVDKAVWYWIGCGRWHDNSGNIIE